MLNLDFLDEYPKLICHDEYNSLAPKILEGLKSYHLNNHFILFSSGTTSGDLKGYAVSKTALFANAKAVNDFFGLTSDDVWALSLPIYHIGGLSVLARANLLGNKVIDARTWEPNSWLKKIEEATITTIVPTQLYDLVKLKLKPSSHLRYLIVGGDFLSSGLKDEAMALGWPVIRTFGMSEVCSQLASTRTPTSNELEVLPIHKIKTDKDQRLWVKSESLFTLQFMLHEGLKVTTLHDLCNEEGFYKTSDRANISGDTLEHLGRIGDEFKIAGHLVNMNQLKNTLGSYLVQHDLFGQMELVLEESERKGKKLILMTLTENSLAVSQIADLLYPVKIDEIRTVTSFERTALGKLKY